MAATTAASEHAGDVEEMGTVARMERTAEALRDLQRNGRQYLKVGMQWEAAGESLRAAMEACMDLGVSDQRIAVALQEVIPPNTRIQGRAVSFSNMAVRRWLRKA